MTATTSIADVESTEHSGIELRNFLAPVEIMIYRSSVEPGWLIVKVHVRTADRDTGECDAFGSEWLLKLPTTRERIVEVVREALIGQLTHEVDECLFVDGVRVRDPHAVHEAGS